MAGKRIETQIKNAVQRLIPDQAEKIYEIPVEKASGNEWYLDGIEKTGTFTGKRFFKTAAVFAACLLFCFGIYQIIGFQKECTVYLDVNPSVELASNKKDRVVEAKALNKDGEDILSDLKLKNTDMETAVNAVLGAMVRKGYLNRKQNEILISVEGKNSKKVNELKVNLSQEVSGYLSPLIGMSKVYSQKIEESDTITSLAQKYKISPGKAVLIQKLKEQNPELSFEELAGLSITELKQKLMEVGIYLEEYVESPGAESKEEGESYDKTSKMTDKTTAVKQEESKQDETKQKKTGMNPEKTKTTKETGNIDTDSKDDLDEDDDDRQEKKKEEEDSDSSDEQEEKTTMNQSSTTKAEEEISDEMEEED
ncbi:MAG: hypothetical protein Q4B70_10445 [Lachnospiraceae bacterium]|nr:hypothetical protein [Lachnospiraceae bacterium]